MGNWKLRNIMAKPSSQYNREVAIEEIVFISFSSGFQLTKNKTMNTTMENKNDRRKATVREFIAVLSFAF